MIGSDGVVTVVDPETIRRLDGDMPRVAAEMRRQLNDPDAILAFGDQAELEKIGTKVRLGNREQRRRAARRKMQKDSRRANR